MNKLKEYEKKQQEMFEQKIELLILYKKSHMKEDVYLSDDCIHKAFKWYHETLSDAKQIMKLT